MSDSNSQTTSTVRLSAAVAIFTRDQFIRQKQHLTADDFAREREHKEARENVVLLIVAAWARDLPHERPRASPSDSLPEAAADLARDLLHERPRASPSDSLPEVAAAWARDLPHDIGDLTSLELNHNSAP